MSEQPSTERSLLLPLLNQEAVNHNTQIVDSSNTLTSLLPWVIHLSRLQLPNLQNGDSNSTYLIELLGGFNELICTMSAIY